MHAKPHRRDLMAGSVAAAFTLAAAPPVRAQDRVLAPKLVSTTQAAGFATLAGAVSVSPLHSLFDMDVLVREDAPQQTIRGFGGCFNELGWEALLAQAPEAREALLDELFSPGKGANLSYCRLPIGANDYARSWYSHDETPGDFAMQHFSIARDRERILPFVHAAKARRADLRLWASPWSPPSWMKRNGHYAMARSPVPSWPDNGLRPDQVGREGEDMFILEDAYLEAYALYFRRFVEAYAAEGLPISAVMPQNEFNSAQPFPSCCWTPKGLALFIPHLGRQMQSVGVDVVFGTLERGDDRLFEQVYADPAARPYIKGIAAQWAGRRAIPFIHHAHPDLKVFQSEQECGDGRNDWRFARFTFDLMKAFFQSGAEVYDYWNLAAPAGGVSTWGWPQNAFVNVDLKTGQTSINPDYHVFKQLSHFVAPGAVRLDTLSINGTENLLAFKNPDGALVVALSNPGAKPQTVRIAAKGQVFAAALPADSISTLVV